MQVCKAGAGDEETEDVVVDGDDTAAFGPSQFNENDIQSAAADQMSTDDGNRLKPSPFLFPLMFCNFLILKLFFLSFFSLIGVIIKSEKGSPLTFKGNDSKDHIISALKNRVNDLEEMNKEAKQKNRCLICLVRFYLIFFKTTFEFLEFILLLFLPIGRLSATGRVDILLARALRRMLASGIGKIRHTFMPLAPMLKLIFFFSSPLAFVG